MLIEAEAIPYDPAPLRGERLLVLAPHPDDEVIGCGGLIAQHLREHRIVRVVVATDGAKATGAPADLDSYRRQRENESRQGLASLGHVEIDFLQLPDRALDHRVADPIRDILLEFRPDLICVPSPVEIHPDHLALSREFCLLIQRNETLFAELATTRVAFYEISHPLRPNTIVDITDVAEAKYAAIAAHETQIALKDYIAYARGLNSYRAMTLPPEVKLAEGYWVTPMALLHRTSFSELRRTVGAPPQIESVRETIPVSVIIRTKDRPHLLRDAVRSVRDSEYPADIIVVNDGGATPSVSGDRTRVIEHARSQGRSEAMNSGVRAATTKFIAFLDDDDIFYPEHLPALAATVAATPQRAAWYTDALSVFLRIGPSGAYEPQARLRLFANDFDRELLLVDNYIPLPTLLMERQTYLDAGGFDPQFDLFEDWDFLIRLSERGDFQRVPRLTCEIRHFEGGSSIILDSPEGSSRFREAKLKLWRKHAARISNDVFADVFERQKKRLNTLYSDVIDTKGRFSHFEHDANRFEREKAQLLGELQGVHGTVGEKSARIGELEHALENLHREARDNALAADKELQHLNNELQDAHSSLRATHSEIGRLQGLLDMIFKSKTWKMHTMIEKMRGRG
jgi:LmbE family N-acetylglucosaminyl deacetylase/glycosyltransferase involved in cell wall biosynthesis